MKEPKKVYKEVNIMEDKKLITKINIASLILTIAAVVPFAFLAEWLPTIDREIERGLIAYLLYFVVWLLVIVLHEALHGVFYKLFKPEGKVEFGFKNSFAYAASIGNVYSKRRFIIILLAPFVLVTAGTAVAYMAGWILQIEFVVLAAVHTGACIGDFYFTKLIAQSPKDAKVEDTANGIKIFRD